MKRSCGSHAFRFNPGFSKRFQMLPDHSPQIARNAVARFLVAYMKPMDCFGGIAGYELGLVHPPENALVCCVQFNASSGVEVWRQASVSKLHFRHRRRQGRKRIKRTNWFEVSPKDGWWYHFWHVEIRVRISSVSRYLWNAFSSVRFCLK